jgi:hypothetical protein
VPLLYCGDWNNEQILLDCLAAQILKVVFQTRLGPRAVNASITSPCVHPAWQCSNTLPSASRMLRLGLLSSCAGHFAIQHVPERRALRACAMDSAVMTGNFLRRSSSI